jgi:hypothetical protein
MLEMSELEKAATCWDWVSYISLVLAFLGAVTEFIANWTGWIKTPWRSQVKRTSTMVVLLGSAVGLVATWKLSNINGQITEILKRQVAVAQTEAAKATVTAADAQTRPAPAQRATEPPTDHAQGQGETPRMSWARLLKRVSDIDIEHCLRSRKPVANASRRSRSL